MERQELVTVGSYWQHYKGEVMIVTGLSKDTENEGALRVEYRHVSDPESELPWSRPLGIFLETRDVSEGFRWERFKFLGEQI
jgi:hypothetical protein